MLPGTIPMPELSEASTVVDFPSVIATGSGNGSATSFTATFGTNVSGDLLMVFVGQNNTVASVTTPSGYTLAGYFTTGGLNTGMGSNSCLCAVYYKTSTGSESGVTISASNTNSRVWLSYVIRDWSSIELASSVATGNSTKPDPPAITPTWGSQKMLVVPFGNADRYATAAPSGYTLHRHYLGTGAEFGNCYTAYAQFEASSEDPGTFTIYDNRPWRTTTLAIRGG